MSSSLCSPSNAACQAAIDHIIPALGVLTAAAISFSPWKAMMKAFNDKNLGSTNPIPYAILTLNSLSWMSYGLLVKDYYVAAPNILGLMMGLLDPRFVGTASNNGVRGGCGADGLLQFPLIGHLWYEQQPILRTRRPNVICMLIVDMNFPDVVRTRNSASLLWPLAVANLINGSLWAAYGVAIKDWFVIGPNIVGAVAAIVQLLLRAIFPQRALLTTVASNENLVMSKSSSDGDLSEKRTSSPA
ncbi:hypothetical protein HK102_013284 [Quaeritorhiza haematococci]|nr:hypothetical protein HK102_013284 [Quaeritorhiza haematococci]